MKPIYKKIFYFIGILTLIFVVANMSYWIYITTQFDTFQSAKTAYLSGFPESLKNALLLTVINICLLGVSIAIFAKALLSDYHRSLSTVLIVVAGILAAWNVFSLM